MPSLTVDQITKRYRTGTEALSGVSFAVEPGTLLAVVGHNGAGKSTLLNIVSGLIRPTSGTVATDIGRGRLMWSPQRTMIDWSLTVRQNIELVARLTGTPSSSIDRVLELLDLDKVSSQQAEYISGGQLQRVQIGRALVADAAVYVLDEPTAGLDPAAGEVVMEYLRERAAAGATVLVSSHDLDAVERTASDLVLLDEGRLRAHLPIQEFVRRAGATMKVSVVFAEPMPEPYPDRLARDLPPQWTLETDADRAGLSVQVPLATGLRPVLAWLPSELQVQDLSAEKQSLRDVYLARYAERIPAPESVMVQQ
ncbi:ABC transporter ATP-binding protein [Streptomyces broussonetiae]|uniref:ATP-binding cassette domain-containing protein n=1 Tax=Streptomyces broussonetiae TaxID=2686304 RepID=A0A6I6MSF7_9ACTN|nr:ABC transporter ATP-binding protein [Streptomyces broussonetiae]QHA02412.1 ATP-binding cassette domain-containing protein [Streptomyces broussonetiae]